jgi:hypothetical protein
MSSKKRLIRRYLLAAIVGGVEGFVCIAATYQCWCNRCGFDEAFVNQQINIRSQYDQEFRSAGRELVNRSVLLYFLIYSGKADLLANIFLGSTLLVPYAVYTFDVVAASRRKQGAV